jgi:hypothetical protein
MSQSDARHALLAPVVERFPDQQAHIYRLALRDEGFRALCEEYDLARKSYGRLQVSPERAAEVAEYRSVIAELEEEIRSFLGSGKDRK